MGVWGEGRKDEEMKRGREEERKRRRQEERNGKERGQMTMDRTSSPLVNHQGSQVHSHITEQATNQTPNERRRG